MTTSKLVRADSRVEGLRLRIFDHVRRVPGQSIAEIAMTMGVSHSTAGYHLEPLVERGLLAATKDGNKTRFFAPEFTDEERRVLSALSNSETRRVLGTILANPGACRAELKNSLGVSGPTVDWHVARLVGSGLVIEERHGHYRDSFADANRLRKLFDSLSLKLKATRYDRRHLRELARLCGAE